MMWLCCKKVAVFDTVSAKDVRSEYRPKIKVVREQSVLISE